MWKRLISDYFSFTKKDRTGIIVLLSLIILFTLVPFLYPYFIKKKNYEHTSFEKEVANLKIKEADTTNKYVKRKYEPGAYQNYDRPSNNNYGSKTFKGELFNFDPNLTSPADWKRLGLRDKTVATIQNFLSKGGKFYKKEDIGKIWGLHEDEIERLMPYVQIAPTSTSAFGSGKQYEKKVYEKKSYEPTYVDVNKNDTAAFIALPGIGIKLSQRIVNFRERLGGFYKIEQIGETFGLADSTFQKIKPYLKLDNSALKKININTATLEQLKAHPYLRYALGNAIIQYRSQHGNFTSITDIKKIMLITDDVFNKVAPYLIIN